MQLQIVQGWMRIVDPDAANQIRHWQDGVGDRLQFVVPESYGS